MVTVIRPSRARCVKGRIPRHDRVALPFKEGRMLVASTSVAMVASVHPTEKNSARSSSRHVHCRHRQISSRRASERAVFNAPTLGSPMHGVFCHHMHTNEIAKDVLTDGPTLIEKVCRLGDCVD